MPKSASARLLAAAGRAQQLVDNPDVRDALALDETILELDQAGARESGLTQVLNLLALTCKNRYVAAGVATDLDAAVELFESATKAADADTVDQARALYSGANALRWRLELIVLWAVGIFRREPA